MVAARHRPGDLGRRIAHRRRELGLSREQVASLTGMAPEYLAYVERYHANLTPAALYSLALALDTTVDVLLGTAVETPPGAHTGTSGEPRFERLHARECMSLLSAGGIGRVVFVAEHGPEAVPVNFTTYEGGVAFRAAKRTVIVQQVGHIVGFEVDRLDEALRQGWSVLVSGRLRRVDDPRVIARVHATIQPWAGTNRHVYLTIAPTRVAGRRITT